MIKYARVHMAEVDRSRLLHVVGSLHDSMLLSLTRLGIVRRMQVLLGLDHDRLILFLLHGPRFGNLAEYGYAYTSNKYL